MHQKSENPEANEFKPNIADRTNQRPLEIENTKKRARVFDFRRVDFGCF